MKTIQTIGIGVNVHGALDNSDIVVVGSLNMDLVATAPHIPTPGETVQGQTFTEIPGGKGANQARAAARLGHRVAFVGRCGADRYGKTLTKELVQAGVDCRNLKETPDAATGVALIVVSQSGENAICVVGGANRCLTVQDIDDAESLISVAKVCVLQLEIPLETAAHAVALARRHGVETILDPAPAPADPPAQLLDVDILSPNQIEAARLLGGALPSGEPGEIAAALGRCGARAVVLKLGAGGSQLHDGHRAQLVPGFRVKVVDTTAAGDAFTAALAVARAEGMPLPGAVRFANAAGALACTRRGAQPAMPSREEVEALLAG